MPVTLEFTQGQPVSGPTGPTGAASSVTGPTGFTGPTGAADYTLVQNAQTDSYTLALTDANKLVEVNKSTSVNVTVPQNSSIPYAVGTQIHVLQVGAGQITFVADTNVTINATPGLKISGQWRMATLIKRATNTWVAVGSLTA